MPDPVTGGGYRANGWRFVDFRLELTRDFH